MAVQDRAPGGIDTTTPNVARIYDYLLRGKDNFAADREAAKRLIKAIPDIAGIARDNRSFLGRVVRYLAIEGGYPEFLDPAAACRPRLTCTNWPRGWRPERGWSTSITIPWSPRMAGHSSRPVTGPAWCSVICVIRPASCGTRTCSACLTWPGRSRCYARARKPSAEVGYSVYTSPQVGRRNLYREETAPPSGRTQGPGAIPPGPSPRD